MSNLDKQMPLPAVGCENCKTLEQWVHDCQAGMYINCVYCGHRYGPDDEVAPTMQQALYDHIAECPKHPLSAMKRRAERAEARLAHPEDAPRITMTKSYLSGRQCCDFTIAEDDSETHEPGCPWRIVDEFAKSVYERYGDLTTDESGLCPPVASWMFHRVEELEEDMTNSPIRRVEDAPGGPTQRALLKAAQKNLHTFGENDDTERGEAAWALAARIDLWICELDRLKGEGETDG